MMRARGEAERGAVGHLTAAPNSRNTNPGLAKVTFEFRHSWTDEIARIAEEFLRDVFQLA